MKHAWIVVLAMLAMLMAAGCAQPPQAVRTAAMVARMDATATLYDLHAMHPDPLAAPPGVTKAMLHLEAIEELLIPAEAYYRGVEPDQVDRFRPTGGER